MNKTAIKNFAIWARVQLIEAAKQRAFEYEITEDGENRADLDSIGGHVLSAQVKEQRRQLISQIQHKGYMQVMEEAAYTWFNRFIALRFMEVNGYLPSKTRVFTDENGEFKPEILKQAMSVEIDGLDRNKVLQLLDAQANEELYKYLIITQCNELNESLPEMFETISNWTELLFPANLLRSDSVLARMVADIPEDDWRDAVQIIGWLYQYYNTELKDDTFAKLKKNVKITKERIPAATQLFTPDWIVRYMVENSLGRLWLEGHPNAELHDGWKYYLDEAEQEPEVEAQLAKLREEYKTIKPEEIKVIDPCMGSGHILVYAFDVLMQIYISAGWDQREAAQSILKNNLYGLDIDDRAAQLAYFAVMMKARQYDRRLLTRGIQPNVYSIRESNDIQTRTVEYFHKNDPKLKTDIESIITEMRDAKEYGSILNITPVDFAGLYARFDEIRSDISMMKASALEELLPLVKCAEALAQKYDVVVTNPPYMGGSGMGAKLAEYVKVNYPNAKSDLFACFIERGNQMTIKHGYNCMVTMQSWMFLSSFEKMRKEVLQTKTITNLMHMENMVMGIAFGTAVTVFRNDRVNGYKGTYNQIKLQDIEKDKPKTFPVPGNRFAQTSTDNFSKIPGSPVAYWASLQMQNAFATAPSFPGNTKKGVLTGDNERFLRLWHEVCISKIGMTMSSHSEMVDSKKKWFPVTSGGFMRKWYGNFDTIVNLENDGFAIRSVVKNYRLREPAYYFREAVTWTEVSSGIFSCRYVPHTILFGNGGPVSFFSNDNLYYCLALLNSSVTMSMLAYLAPTVNYGPEQINKLPVLTERKNTVDNLSKDNVKLSQQDWDSYETSWDFKRNPLV